MLISPVKYLTISLALSGGVLGMTTSAHPPLAPPTRTNLTTTDYGYSVSASKTFLAVGAPGLDRGAGAVYLFHRSSGRWRYQRRITDPAHLAQDAFGWSTSLSSSASGTYLAAGETSINGATNYVYVYRFSAGHWQLQAALKDPQNSSYSNFGYAVALTSGTLAVGAPGANNQYGAAYIYRRSGSHWVLSRSLGDPGTNYRDNFGFSVSVSGETAVVTARDARSSPAAYVYSAGLGHPWTLSATLQNPAGASDAFGWSASVSGNTAVIGAPGSGTKFQQDAAYVYVKSRGKWKVQQRIVSPRGITNDRFGYAVALSANRALIGAPNGGPNNGGIAYEFRRSGSRWHQKLTVKDTQAVPGDGFGSAVSVYGRTGVIGAPGQNKAFLQNLY